jgi:tRNA (guanosine-2'-O-)-methyltransferase
MQFFSGKYPLMGNERISRMKEVIEKRQPAITIAMENVFDPHNISAVLRTCDSVGITTIHIINTRNRPHQHGGFRSSAGAWKWIKTMEYETVPTCLTALRAEQKKVYAAHLCTEAVSIYDVDFTGQVAIVFGNEQEGCSPELLANCDGKIYIPQMGMVQSLNISVACAVVLYEAFRQKLAAGHYQSPAMGLQERESLLQEWTDFSTIRQQRLRKA